MGRGRPPSKTSKAILALSTDLSPKEVVAKLKAQGVKTTENNVYRVRRLSKKGSAKKAARGPSKATHPAAASSSAEGLLRAVAAEIGLGRAIALLEGERARVLSFVGR